MSTEAISGLLSERPQRHCEVVSDRSTAGIHLEESWRDTGRRCGAASLESGIVVSRWAASKGGERIECATTPDGCHIVSLALKAAAVSLSTDSGHPMEGLMPAGSILISHPGQKSRIRIAPPFDFLHIHVANSYLEQKSISLRSGRSANISGFASFRDRLAEAMGQSLLDEHLCRSQPGYAGIVAEAIVLRAVGGQSVPRRCRALPTWRKRRLEEFVEANIEKSISLEDMATAVDLSKMHFAAQFRAATGFRPREYLLLRRIERAKEMMTRTETSIVEVAFSVGFKAQAHFCTVFKRFTGKSPARWKHDFRHAC